MLFKALSAAVYGIDANLIDVELDFSGVPLEKEGFHTVGLPDAAVRESRDRMLEVLRQPLEDHTVTIARASMSMSFPARFMLAAAMNPCPCGFFNDKSRECMCTPE
jgi:predicted ATPase with chaperone activity